MIEPYSEISPGIYFGCERNRRKRKLSYSFREETFRDTYEEPQNYIVADVTNYRDSWFTIELALPDHSQELKIKTRGYPIKRLYPSLYFQLNGRTEKLTLSDFPINEYFCTSCIQFEHLPEKATQLNLAIAVPDCDWFTIGFIPPKGLKHG